MLFFFYFSNIFWQLLIALPDEERKRLTLVTTDHWPKTKVISIEFSRIFSILSILSVISVLFLYRNVASKADEKKKKILQVKGINTAQTQGLTCVDFLRNDSSPEKNAFVAGMKKNIFLCTHPRLIFFLYRFSKWKS